MKHQVDIQWDAPEDFTLVVEKTTDGDRIQREQEQKLADQKEAEKQQQPLI
jgi:hypothetical protein